LGWGFRKTRKALWASKTANYKKHGRHQKNAFIPFNQQNPHKKLKEKKTLKKIKTEP
jgi:hypothetical protein